MRLKSQSEVDRSFVVGGTCRIRLNGLTMLAYLFFWFLSFHLCCIRFELPSMTDAVFTAQRFMLTRYMPWP